MKTLKQHILEKLKVSVRNTAEHTLFPKTKDELISMIKDEISKIDIRKLSYERCLNNTIVILENYKTLNNYKAYKY